MVLSGITSGTGVEAMQLFSSPKSQFPLFSPLFPNSNPNPSVPKPLSKLPFMAFSPPSGLKIPPRSSNASPPPLLQEKLLCSESDEEKDEDQEEVGDDEEKDCDRDEKELEEGKEKVSQEFLAVRRPAKEVSGEENGSYLAIDDGTDGLEASSKIEAGLSDIAKKMPIFEPERVNVAPEEKPLGINLELGLYRAKVLARNFQFEEAEKILRKCILYWPEDGRTYVALGRLLSKQSNFAEARSVYERGCQATQGENSYIWQCWAVLENKVGNIRRARELFDAATVADKRHVAAWHGWAVLEIKQGNIKKARNLLGKGLKYCGGNEYVYQTLALLEAKGNRFEQARYLFRQATLCNPKSCASWLAWAQVEMQQENNHVARQLFEKAIQASPKNRFAWHVWGLFEANQGDIEKGRKLLKIGHALNPRDPVLLQSLALLEYKYSSANLARVLFRKASELDPRHQPVWIAWGWMEWKEGNTSTARELYQQALAIDATSESAARCLQAWGVLEQRIGNLSAARRLFRSSLNINSQSYVTWMTWASLEEKQGNPVRAEEIRNLYFQQRTEVIDDASWVMGLLDIFDPALDSIKRLLNLDQISNSKVQDVVRSMKESNNNIIGTLSMSSSLNDDNNSRSELDKGFSSGDFDLDTFIKDKLSLDASKLDEPMEVFEQKNKSPMRIWRLERKAAFAQP